jgi:hypothetical protein
MRRTTLAWSLGAAALLLAVTAAPIQAGKSGGGRSFSSPSGRSYSSGSGGGRSFSFSGKSYGSSSRGATPSFSGKSYSSAGRSTTPSVTPTRGGKTYSSGATGPRPSAGSPALRSPGPVSIPSPSGKSYGSGRNPGPAWPLGGAGSQSASRSPSPSGKSYGSRAGGFDSAAAAAQQMEESRARYTKGRAPEPTYQDPKGEVRRIDPTDRRVEELRQELDVAHWANWRLRQQQFYGGYTTRPVVVYHDAYSSPFWYWLLDQDVQTRALWYYNHQQVIDQARYQELLARDAALQDRLRRLEAQGGARNPAAAPPGLDPDLMYTDTFVEAVYNPAPPAVVPHHHPAVSFWHGVRVLLYALVVIAVLALLIWLVFFKRWGAAPR